MFDVVAVVACCWMLLHAVAATLDVVGCTVAAPVAVDENDDVIAVVAVAVVVAVVAIPAAVVAIPAVVVCCCCCYCSCYCCCIASW